MKRGDKYTILISEREAAAILVALDISCDFMPAFCFAPGTEDAVKALKQLKRRLQKEGIKIPSELIGHKEICKKDH